jgi:TetR/AcrR family transcriptional regulator, regulator of cefoperazone and chloramphenicol sensitivity
VLYSIDLVSRLINNLAMSTDSPVVARPGDTTREALIQAAIDAFGRSGFDAASTRAIAQAAGVNQALIGYHFRGKSGLYHAVLQHIAAQIQRRIGPLAAAIEAELGADTGPAANASVLARSPSARCLDLLHELTDAFAAMLTSDESGAWARLILREQQDPSAGFDVLYGGIMSRLLDVVSSLVGRIRSVDPASDEARLTAITIVGQALVFRAARAAVVRKMAWETIGPAELAEIQAQIRRNVAAILAEEVSR